MKQLLLRSCLALSSLFLAVPAESAPQKPVKAFWLSPDWIVESGVPSPRVLAGPQVREATVLVLDRLKGLGVNAVLMESWLRGYSLSPVGKLPVYPLTRLSDGGDMMAILLEEAGKRDIAVHAWVHCLFWRTDNPQLTRPHHEGRTIWDDLTAAWLREGAARTTGNVREAALALAQALTEGKEGLTAEILRQSKIPANEGFLQAFVPAFRAAGVPPPEWLVQTPEGDIHPSSAKDKWMTLYLNPTSPVVIERVTGAIKQISDAYPGLAGIHLDHIRYPRGMTNVPRDMVASLKIGHEFAGGTSGAPYKRWKTLLRERESAVTSFVKGIRAAIRPEHVLSSAVHPLYYFERDEWPGKLSADDFVSQDWHSWDIDMAMPMIYDSDAARVGRVLKRLRFGLSEREGGAKPTIVVPGVNLFRLMKELPAWVYFDFDGLRQIKAGTSPQTAKEEADEPSDTMD